MVHEEITTSCPLSLLLNAVLDDARHSDAAEILLQPEAKQMRVLYRVGDEFQEQLRLRRFVTPLLTEHLRERICAQADQEMNPTKKAFLLRFCNNKHAVHVSYAMA